MPEISGRQIQDGSIEGVDIEDGSIAGSDIAQGSIGLSNLSQAVRDTISTGSSPWKNPVTNTAALPLSENTLGDVRITLDNFKLWIWNGNSWVDPTANFLSLNR